MKDSDSVATGGGESWRLILSLGAFALKSVDKTYNTG